MIKNSGFTDMNLMDIWKVCDDVYVQKSHNLTLPDWIAGSLDKFMELRDIDFFLDFRTAEMAKLAAGGVLNELRKNIQLKVNRNSSSSAQLILFSSVSHFWKTQLKFFF